VEVALLEPNETVQSLVVATLALGRSVPKLVRPATPLAHPVLSMVVAVATSAVTTVEDEETALARVALRARASNTSTTPAERAWGNLIRRAIGTFTHRLGAPFP
jgi:hypothetical protein